MSRTTVAMTPPWRFLLGPFVLAASSVSSTALRRGGTGTGTNGATGTISAPHRDLSAAAAAAFPTDLRNARCPDLTAINKNLAPDAETCAALCEADEGCDLWSYCPPPNNSCELHADGTYSAGNWARCYVSTATSSRGPCVPDQGLRWIGGARPPPGQSQSAPSDRVPAKTAEPSSPKRGFSGYLNVDRLDGTTMEPVCSDGAALGRENSWYYTWMTRTSAGDRCRNEEKLWGAGPDANGGSQMGAEYVPMLNGLGQAQYVLNDVNSFRVEWTRANAHFLLGYNEPDPSPNHPHSEPNHTRAAEDWVLVQQVAMSFDPPLRLVSPAPASEDFDEDGVSEWLDLFLGNCTHVVPECDPSLIEIIAFHDYKGDINLLERRINGMAAHYGRPLWLTEYSIGRWDPPHGPPRPEQEAYMMESLTLLENHHSIYRYVWFNARDNPGPWGGTKDLLAWNVSEPTITSTGTIYKTWPEGPTTTTTTTTTTTLPPPPEYEPVPGTHLVLGASGESCTSACLRSGKTCTENSLLAAAPFATSATIETTALALGVECNRNMGNYTSGRYPQIRPDKLSCFAKDGGVYDCDKVGSAWVVPGQRICSCEAPAMTTTTTTITASSTTTTATSAPPPVVYEAEPGLHLTLSDGGASCTSACERTGRVCTEGALAAAAPYGHSNVIESTALALGVTCSKNMGNYTGRAFPQIRPDKLTCFAKDGDKYGCDDVSGWVVPGERLCSCVSSGGGLAGDPCVHSVECESGVCSGSQTCV